MQVNVIDIVPKKLDLNNDMIHVKLKFILNYFAFRFLQLNYSKFQDP